jgi:hypothetical protein
MRITRIFIKQISLKVLEIIELPRALARGSGKTENRASAQNL